MKAAADAYFHHDLHGTDVVAWPTNLGWMMGPWLIFATMINRATIALYTGPPSDPEFARFIESARVSELGLVPSMVRHWRAKNLLDGIDWTGIRAFSSTGECSNAEDMRWLSEQAGGRPIIEYCGGTEIGGGYITSTLVQPNLPSTFSTPAIGSDFVLLDEQGQPADNGEVYLIPPALGLSRRLLNRDHHETYYADCPRHPVTGRPLRRHGDQVRRLNNGYYQMLGRADDTMNLGGIKVSAAEVERALAAPDGDTDTPTLTELAAIAVPPPGGGPSRLVVFVGYGDTSPPDPDRLCQQMRRRLKANLNPLFRVDEVVVLEKLPRTASNKIMRRALRDLYQSRHQEQPRHA
jgi:acetyl-CoA synthetase